MLEFVARMEWRARVIAADAPRPERFLIDKHYLRKHGPSRTYGQ
jgi:ribulose-5-phosphate 4-epimerase/fuculose-1-phosphate aldolase